jgi:hypothetical protein
MKLSREETTNAQQRIELTFFQVQEAKRVLLLFPDKLKKKKTIFSFRSFEARRPFLVTTKKQKLQKHAV